LLDFDRVHLILFADDLLVLPASKLQATEENPLKWVGVGVPQGLKPQVHLKWTWPTSPQFTCGAGVQINLSWVSAKPLRD